MSTAVMRRAPLGRLSRAIGLRTDGGGEVGVWVCRQAGGDAGQAHIESWKLQTGCSLMADVKNSDQWCQTPLPGFLYLPISCLKTLLDHKSEISL